MPEFVQECAIEQESPDGFHGPWLASRGAEFMRFLALHESAGQAHARWQCTDRDFSPGLRNIAKDAGAAAIIEMDGTEAFPYIKGEAAQNDTHIIFIDVVDAVSANASN